MTDEAKALVERLRYTEEHGIFTAHDNGMQAMPGEAADLIETQAREIERLREALKKIAYPTFNCGSHQYSIPMREVARAALGESHDTTR